MIVLRNYSLQLLHWIEFTFISGILHEQYTFIMYSALQITFFSFFFKNTSPASTTIEAAFFLIDLFLFLDKPGDHCPLSRYSIVRSRTFSSSRSLVVSFIVSFSALLAILTRSVTWGQIFQKGSTCYIREAKYFGGPNLTWQSNRPPYLKLSI